MLTESQVHGNAHISSGSHHSPPLSVHDVAMSASDGFSESMSASASETSLARDSGTRKYNTDDEGVTLRHGSTHRSLETVINAIDASVGLSPGDGTIRVRDGSPMDPLTVPGVRGSFPTGVLGRDPSMSVAAVDAGSTNWSPGVAMYGRSPHNESRSELVVSQFVRFRSPDATHWSATTRLNPGDRPVVVRCPAALSPAACYEYLVSLRNPFTNAGSVGGTVSVRPRFVVRGNPLGSTDAIWFRQPESAHAGRLLAGRDESVTLWGDAMGPRSLRFRPDGGAWSWSAPVPVDRPGVIYVKTACLTRDPAEIARLVSKMSSGLTTRAVGTPCPEGWVSTRRRCRARPGGQPPRPSTYAGPGARPVLCRVFFVAVAHRGASGGWETEVSSSGRVRWTPSRPSSLRMVGRRCRSTGRRAENVHGRRRARARSGCSVGRSVWFEKLVVSIREPSTRRPSPSNRPPRTISTPTRRGRGDGMVRARSSHASWTRRDPTRCFG